MADVFSASSDEEDGGYDGGDPSAPPHSSTGGPVAEAAQRRTLHDAGYRDGAGGPEGHALGLQEGFDAGFVQGLAHGRAFGQVLGALRYIHLYCMVDATGSGLGRLNYNPHSSESNHIEPTPPSTSHELSGIQALEERVPRGLPVPALAAEDKQRLEASLQQLTALAPTMPAAADPAVAPDIRNEAVHLLEAAGVCRPGDAASAGVESVLGPSGPPPSRRAEGGQKGCE
jgi:hypothetical protein